jgi:hypothetical protein
MNQLNINNYSQKKLVYLGSSLLGQHALML